MPYNEPSAGDLHVDSALTDLSVAFQQEEEGFVADRAFRIVRAGKRSDRYFLFERGEFNRDEMAKRAPGTESAGGTYTIDNSPSFFCDEYAFHRDIADSIRDNADPAVENLEEQATQYLSMKALLRKDVEWAANFFVTSIWTNEVTGVDSASPTAGQFGRWDRADSDPIERVRAGRTATKLSGGLRPNVFACGTEVYDSLLDHPDIIGRLDRGQTSGPAMTNRQQLAALFEVEEVLVLDAIKNSANKGATESNAFIGGKNALLFYRPATPGRMTPAAGYTFAWTGRFGAGTLGTRIRRFRMEHLNSDRHEIEGAWDQKLVSADLGYFFLDAVS